ncbi:DsbA family protein [Rhodoplanes azumiensis]|uniref:DsbA family protein n=1 Tax=Rhodoplanes azumiensis TaxID=1897628 RepID=A0ABW5AEZ6_9BRAD
MRRRDVMLLAAGAALAATAPGRVRPAAAQAIDRNAILRDPEAPTFGNPTGDVTLVAFFDYNCPFCKKAEPDLERAATEDGRIRLVFKDWPILTEASVVGARLALAAAYQDGYALVHRALMAIPGRRVPEEQMREAVRRSGVDLARLQADHDRNSDKITALLRRNAAQAEAIGLQGTPSYLIGPFRTSTLDYAGFKQAFAEARRRQAAP